LLSVGSATTPFVTPLNVPANYYSRGGLLRINESSPSIVPSRK
jgi:hypothetical protein